ncbi:hypothetical protein Tco_0996843, partial [Tanacetum coccineum]
DPTLRKVELKYDLFYDGWSLLGTDVRLRRDCLCSEIEIVMFAFCYLRLERYAYPSIFMIVWIEWVRLPSICVVIGAAGMPTLVCVRSCPNLLLQLVGPLGVSIKVPVPLPDNPYEAIRQAYLVGMDVESEPFEDPVKTEAPESPHTVASPTSPPDSTPPTLVPILRRTARMAVRVPPTMSPGLSASMAEVAAMSDSAFRKRFRSSYKSSPSSSPLDLPSRKRYQGTSELVKDDKEEEDDEEGDDEEEDEEMEESLDSYSVSKDVEDEGFTAEDEDPATGDEGLATGDEGPGIGVESLILGRNEAVPEG